ncbi:hypothetical protein GRI91_13635 [Altererythrobacter endophyticus]|uniref:Uncharacterized protein n=2 Tax=Altericroceibacterium endophyticum TaxID=1808508 RepID=A0A6I4T947_9SPHN|nr:hypothetical protein [Altericroceibacterium endophyticum]MXO66802.1 hypothetical protein [Altericroceibacterium endophyticum]
MLALAACGPEEISSPGTGGDIIIENPAPTPTPGTPTPTPSGTYTAAASCPSISGVSDGGIINVPGGTVRSCVLPSTFTSSTTLSDTPDDAKVVYEISGAVNVGDDADATYESGETPATNVTLTIQPGVVLFGGTGNSYLVVNRGNKINAVGSANDPIIFTSRQNILGNTSDSDDGQWGGVILLGRAPISDCPSGTPGTADCENQIEGVSSGGFFGGGTDNDNSGVMKYFQIRYSGFAIAKDNELQSLTTGGTGTGTEVDYFQSFNSSDDGMEFFGGYMNMKHAVVVGASDDSIDTDFGVQANMQYVIAVQRASTGNGIIEADSSSNQNNPPRQDTRIANATFLQLSDTPDAAAWKFRGGADLSLANVVLEAKGNECIDIDQVETNQTRADAATGSGDENGHPFFSAVYMQCSTPFTDDSDVNAAAVEASFKATSNDEFSGGVASDAAFTSTLTNFVNGTNESAAVSWNPTPFNRNGFTFDNVGYVGAVRDANDTWYRGWTCDSSIANFGSGVSCSASPFN